MDPLIAGAGGLDLHLTLKRAQLLRISAIHGYASQPNMLKCDALHDIDAKTCSVSFTTYIY